MKKNIFFFCFARFSLYIYLGRGDYSNPVYIVAQLYFPQNQFFVGEVIGSRIVEKSGKKSDLYRSTRHFRLAPTEFDRRIAGYTALLKPP